MVSLRNCGTVHLLLLIHPIQLMESVSPAAQPGGASRPDAAAYPATATAALGHAPAADDGSAECPHAEPPSGCSRGSGKGKLAVNLLTFITLTTE